MSKTTQDVEHRSQDQVARESVIQRILENGKVVWIVFGVYHDRSGSKILGVYFDQEAAEDRVQIAREAGAAYSVNYAKVPIGKAFTVDLNP